MSVERAARRILSEEAKALLTRVVGLRPFALFMPMVPAATVAPEAGARIERHLARGRRQLTSKVRGFLRWLDSAAGRRATPAEGQRKLMSLRLRFNAVLSQYDIFSVVYTQRAEHEHGVWLSGLDAFAADALRPRNTSVETPPVVCYLDKGPGAAIRRARTRLPGGGENPVAVVRVPRERMVGAGIASSLVHEVGHQAQVLLELNRSLSLLLSRVSHTAPSPTAWTLFERWLSEIVPDLWSVSRVGIGAPRGMMGVLSLPTAFVFRVNMDDPHPIPWIRVRLSCAMGNALYPHPQWKRLSDLWARYYPPAQLDPERRRLMADIDGAIPHFVRMLLACRPRRLEGRALGEAMALPDRVPERLSARYDSWLASPERLYRTPPSLAFAVIGQARAEGKLKPEGEGRIVSRLLNHWALRSRLEPGNGDTHHAAVPAYQRRGLLPSEHVLSAG